MSIEKQLEELNRNLAAVAAALTKLAEEPKGKVVAVADTPTEEPEEKVAEKPKKVAKKKEAPAEEPTEISEEALNDLRKRIIAYSGAHTAAEARALLLKVGGVKTLSDLDPADYDAVYEAFEEAA